MNLNCRGCHALNPVTLFLKKRGGVFYVFRAKEQKLGTRLAMMIVPLKKAF